MKASGAQWPFQKFNPTSASDMSGMASYDSHIRMRLRRTLNADPESTSRDAAGDLAADIATVTGE